MDIEYDTNKDAANRCKHRLPLALGGHVISAARERGSVIPDVRKPYGEPRYIAYGAIGGRLMVCVFTPRGERIRVISLRKANARERAAYG